LKKLDLESGFIQVLADVPGNLYGGAWSAEGDILLANGATKGVQRLSAAGGAASPVTTLDPSRQEQAHL
jgi:hypothetical protein